MHAPRCFALAFVVAFGACGSVDMVGPGQAGAGGGGGAAGASDGAVVHDARGGAAAIGGDGSAGAPGGSGGAGGGEAAGAGGAPCIDVNAQGFARNAACPRDGGAACFAACTLTGDRFVGCVAGAADYGACYANCAACP